MCISAQSLPWRVGKARRTQTSSAAPVSRGSIPLVVIAYSRRSCVQVGVGKREGKAMEHLGGGAASIGCEMSA